MRKKQIDKVHPHCACDELGQEKSDHTSERCATVSRLLQWPCKLSLVPTSAPYLDGMDVLISADCAPYAYASFHNDFMKNKITLTVCPRSPLERTRESLEEILKANRIKSITVVKMEVGCCRLLDEAVISAVKSIRADIPISVVTLTTGGKILSRREK